MKRGFCSAGRGLTKQAPVPVGRPEIASGVAEDLRGAGPAVLQHPADRDNQHRQHGGADQQCDGAAGEEVRQQRQLIGSHDRRSARRQVTQRAGAEPQPHHLAAHSLRRQQSHGRCSPIGLRHSSPSVSIRMLPTSHSDTPALPLLRTSLRRQHQAKACRCAQDANDEFGHTRPDERLRASAGHAQLNTGARRMMINKALIDWNQTAISKSPIIRLV